VAKLTNKRYGVVYLITNIVNNKKYVGITTRSIDSRFEEHCKADSLIGKAIRKYGKDNFTIEIIAETTSKEDTVEKEIYYISNYNSFENGYNLTIGGDGVVQKFKREVPLSEEQIEYLNNFPRDNNRHKDYLKMTKVEFVNATIKCLVKMYLECEYELGVKRIFEFLKGKRASDFNFLEAFLETGLISEYHIKKYVA